MITVPELPSLGDWGWNKGQDGWEVYWTTLPEAAEACRAWLQERLQWTLQVHEGSTSYNALLAMDIVLAN